VLQGRCRMGTPQRILQLQIRETIRLQAGVKKTGFI